MFPKPQALASPSISGALRNNMNKSQLIALLMIIAIFLGMLSGACESTTPAPTEEQPQATEQAQPAPAVEAPTKLAVGEQPAGPVQPSVPAAAEAPAAEAPAAGEQPAGEQPAGEQPAAEAPAAGEQEEAPAAPTAE